MSPEKYEDIQTELIRRLCENLDEVYPPEIEGPGVYYMAVRPHGEFYIVEQTSPIISDRVKLYGKQHPDYAGLLFYSLEDERGGSKIVDYEIEKYSVKHGLPDHDSSMLHAAAIYAAEDHPEYFGLYPAPIHTPWGYTLRYQCIENGIIWLETDQCREALTICYPIWNACLSEDAVHLGVAMDCDQQHGTSISLGYLFFSKADACIPIFELMRTRPEWGRTGRITVPALMNTIWRNHPGYVLAHNLREQLGANDILYRLLGQLGVKAEPHISADNMITLFPDAGIEYIKF